MHSWYFEVICKELTKETHSSPGRASYGWLLRANGVNIPLSFSLSYFARHRVIFDRDISRIHSNWIETRYTQQLIGRQQYAIGMLQEKYVNLCKNPLKIANVSNANNELTSTEKKSSGEQKRRINQSPGSKG